MILAANQPYFFPYLGYWQLINAADVFLVADDVTFRRKSWICRNRILVSGRPYWLRLQVQDASSFRLIMDTRLSGVNSFLEKLRTLEMAYHKAPFFADVYDLASRVFAFDSKGMLSPFLENSIREVCGYLGIDTVIGRCSDYPENSRYHREKSIYYLCRELGADTYINLPGGQALYDFGEFGREGIELRFIQPRMREYPQFRGPFVPSLSILDIMMFNSREAVHEMLSDFDYVLAPNTLTHSALSTSRCNSTCTRKQGSGSVSGTCVPPAITVVCLTYNHREYIRDALEGFLMQETDFPFEVLVHDDASSDGTADIVREYEKNHPGIIKGIYQSENQLSKGVEVTREFIYPRVRGKYVAFCEGDDYWTDPKKLQKQYDILQARPELDSCAHRVLSVDIKGKERMVAPAARSRVLKAEEVIVGGGGFISTASLMCRREVFLQMTPMREVLTMDYVLQIQASLRGGMYYMEESMAVYRKGFPGSWSVRNIKGLSTEIQDRMLLALDAYTEGRFHSAIETRRRINHSKDLLRGRKYLAMLKWGEIRITLLRLRRELRRFAIKLHYCL